MDKLDPQTRVRILGYLQRTLTLPDPVSEGEALTGKFAGQMRYRMGDYRITYVHQVERQRIVVLRVGHRRQVYR